MSNSIKAIIISDNGNKKLLDTTINSLKKINGKINYIIAINNNDKALEKCLKEEKDNYFKYLKKDDIFINNLSNIEEDYVWFLHEGDTVKLESIHTINTLIKDENINIGNIQKVFPKFNNIEDNFNTNYFNISETIIKKYLITNNIFDNIEDTYYYEINFLTKLISLNGRINQLDQLSIDIRNNMMSQIESRNCNYDLKWYNEIFDSFKNIKDFSIKKYGVIIPYIQSTYLNLLYFIIYDNFNTRNKHIIKGKLLKDFESKSIDFLQNIDDSTIVKFSNDRPFNAAFLKLKNGEKNLIYKNYKQSINLFNKNTNKLLFNASAFPLDILLMDYKDGNLNIIGQYGFPMYKDNFKLYAKYNNQSYYAKHDDLYSEYKTFGKTIFTKYAFNITIPLIERDNKEYIYFYLENEDSTNIVQLNFKTPLSKLTKLKYSYWDCDKYTINYRKDGLLVLKNTKKRHIKREIMYLISLLLNKDLFAKKSAIIRIFYHITHPFYKNKRIWLFEDKIYKGGDNGEYLYTYSLKQKDNIKKYYVLDKKCIDAKRFKKERKPFINYCTIKHKLLYLNSEVVFNTHNGSVPHHSFSVNVEKYFRDLFNTNNVCIQHGLSVQYIPRLINRINDNLKMFFLASPIEYENLTNKEYDYIGYEDSLKITGCPRYDGLKNNDKKQILITPTWRNYLAVPVTDIKSVRNKNNSFKNSDYYKIYNKLINTNKLIETAKETGYKIVFLLHPCTSSQIDDFEKNDSVEIIASTEDLNYEKILTESSLMVTDYSGVQFDFAYMYKPIIYFHPNELPPSYDEGAYKYDTMSLGEIVKNKDELIDLLCEYMHNKCQIKGEYKKRIDKFFKYHDDNNSKRIYDIAKDYFKK